MDFHVNRISFELEVDDPHVVDLILEDSQSAFLLNFPENKKTLSIAVIEHWR